MGGKTCGTCIHYRCIEEPIWEGHSVITMREYCANDIDRPCGYCCLACNGYAPDQDYIDFIFGTGLRTDA